MPEGHTAVAWSRRDWIAHAGAWASTLAAGSGTLRAQVSGERPARAESVSVVNPRNRRPVSWIIDDSTCLVNLNRFAMPQFDEAFGHGAAVYRRNWKDWPVEIPDAFVRRFADWCDSQGVRGKYSVVPYPACVGRIDRGLPGWTRQELQDSIRLVRERLAPAWDIHPEMLTHTRVIDLKTGHPHPETSLKYMENWEWTTGRSADEIGEYMAYALRILKEVGLDCDGVTTPGGFGNKALPQLARAAESALREVMKTEIPHYFRHMYTEGAESVAPRVENVSGLGSGTPTGVVSVVACAGDWTGGWDNTEPSGADRFITADLSQGRMVDVIARNEPAIMLAHWTGIWWNGEERGFRVFQEAVKRLRSRYDDLIWMKLSEISRYWMARELTTIVTRSAASIAFQAPFECPDFTLHSTRRPAGSPTVHTAGAQVSLREVSSPKHLESGTWCRSDEGCLLCWKLAKGGSEIHWG